MARVTDAAISEQALIESASKIAHPLHDGDLACYDPLLEMIGDARIVMLGEATHGTHEFYRERARITTRLVSERGFQFVGIEGDWPEAYRVHRYACGGPGTARNALGGFKAFPTWMWNNLDTLHFVEWLRRHNDTLPEGQRKIGFFGLDLYSLYASIEGVIQYLEKVDPRAGEAAQQRYACFEQFAQKELYAEMVGLGMAESCEQEAVTMLQELQRNRDRLQELSPDDTYFYAVQSARSAADGERYYRTMYRSDENSWNQRDCHMVDTLDALLDHYGPNARAVIWEHNTHIGDFRATADAYSMVNVGQLVRERHPNESIAIGFGTYGGTVTAARAWGAQPQHMTVPDAQSGSYDNAFHQTELERLLLLLKPLRERGQAEPFKAWRGQRAIGVVYHPEYERGNYVPTRLADRYDAYIHIDQTHGLRPLGTEPGWTGPMEQTYPTGY